MIKKIITSTALLATLSSAAVYASTAPAAPVPAPAAPAAAVSASAVPAGVPSTTPITNPDGDMYLANVVAAVSSFSHREILSIFSAASLVPLIQNGQPVDMKALRATAAASSAAPGAAPSPTPGDNPSPTQGVVCLQKLSNGGIYRSHSNNRNARGPVSSKSDLDAFTPLFDLKAGGKFVLNVAANADGTGDIISYIGQVVAKDGDGKAGGDTLCFARYLQVAPGAAASAASAAMASGAGAAKAAAASGSVPAAAPAPATSTSSAPASTSSTPAAATA